MYLIKKKTVLQERLYKLSYVLILNKHAYVINYSAKLCGSL